jgi:DNA-binding MarR family transcriptional regulator
MADIATARAQAVDTFLSLVEVLKRRQAEDKSWISLDLTMAQLKALMIVLQTGGVASRGLAEHLSISPSAVTPLVDQLVEQKLVTREDDPSDRRVVLIRPTARAIALRRRLLETSRAAVVELLDGIPAAQVPGVQRALEQMLDAATQTTTRKEGSVAR